MPVYEYYCSHCNTKFEALRTMKQADDPIPCENCESERTARVLSVFFATVQHGLDRGGQSVSGMTEGGGGCGCGGACSCGHSHN
jgi:putative FmdB family regulatory protein